MTQNLRLADGINLTPANSNIVSNYVIPNTTFPQSGENSLDEQIEYSGDPITGYLYNLCAASAGTKCNWTDASNVANDICPAGWHMPSYDEFSRIVDDTSVYSSFSFPSNSLYMIQIDPLGWGMWLYGYGAWWSSTSSSDIYQYQAWYNSSDNTMYLRDQGFTGTTNKADGLSVRCVRS